MLILTQHDPVVRQLMTDNSDRGLWGAGPFSPFLPSRASLYAFLGERLKTRRQLLFRVRKKGYIRRLPKGPSLYMSLSVWRQRLARRRHSSPGVCHHFTGSTVPLLRSVVRTADAMCRVCSLASQRRGHIHSHSACFTVYKCTRVVLAPKLQPEASQTSSLALLGAVFSPSPSSHLVL